MKIPKPFLDIVDIITESDDNQKTERECEIALTFFYECLSDSFYTTQQLKEFIERVSKQYTDTL